MVVFEWTHIESRSLRKDQLKTGRVFRVCVCVFWGGKKEEGREREERKKEGGLREELLKYVGIKNILLNPRRIKESHQHFAPTPTITAFELEDV